MAWIWEVPFEPDAGAELGSYDLRLKFTDSDGLESLWLESLGAVEVRVHPEAKLTVSNTTPKAGVTIRFHASASIGEGLTYHYDFGDGQTTNWSSNTEVTHTYSQKGSYTTKLKVKDTYGEESAWFVVEVTVSDVDSTGGGGNGGDNGGDDDDDDGGFIPGFGLVVLSLALVLVVGLRKRRGI